MEFRIQKLEFRKLTIILLSTYFYAIQLLVTYMFKNLTQPKGMLDSMTNWGWKGVVSRSVQSQCSVVSLSVSKYVSLFYNNPFFIAVEFERA
jgi:hypothetical protein